MRHNNYPFSLGYVSGSFFVDYLLYQPLTNKCLKGIPYLAAIIATYYRNLYIFLFIVITTSKEISILDRKTEILHLATYNCDNSIRE
jgi:hypothetical protein